MNNNNIKRVLLTGGTSGLGLEAGKMLVKEGYNVCATGRSFRDKEIDSCRFSFIRADFSSLVEVSDTVKKITEKDGIPDIIINNAGILSPPDFTLSKDGFELSFQVNFLSHLVLNELIVNRMNHNDRLLIVSITSPVFRHITPEFKIPAKINYSAFKAYAESKYYMLLLGTYLKKKYPDKKIDFIGFNPGTFRSGIYRMQGSWFHSMYRIAAPFMRDPRKIAVNLVNLISNERTKMDLVYKYSGKKTYQLPPLTGKPEGLFLACEAAVNIVG